MVCPYFPCFLAFSTITEKLYGFLERPRCDALRAIVCIRKAMVKKKPQEEGGRMEGYPWEQIKWLSLKNTWPGFRKKTT